MTGRPDADGYIPLLSKTNLFFDEDAKRLTVDIPTHANIARDTVGRYARGPRAEAIALIYENEAGETRNYSFAELDNLSDRFAVALTELGVRRGEPVAVQTGQTPETAIAHLAIYKLGAVVLTLSQLYGANTVEHILNDAGARVIVSQRNSWNALRESWSRFTSLEHCIIAGGAEVAGEIDFADCLTKETVGFVAVETEAEEPALLLYTSGSTGMPKGMLHGHRVLHAYLPTVTMFYDLELDRHDAVFWSPADWAWVGGLLDLVLPAWMLGQAVVACQHRFEPEWVFDFMARRGVTHSFMTPTALKRLAEVKKPRARWDLSLRVVCTGGESLPSDVVRWADEELGIVCKRILRTDRVQPSHRKLQSALSDSARLHGTGLSRANGGDHR